MIRNHEGSAHPLPVLLLIGGLGPAGAEQQARLLLENLPRERIRVRLACFQAPPEVVRALRDAGVEVDQLPKPSQYVWPIHTFQFLQSIVQAHGIRVVHAFLPDLAVVAVALGVSSPGLAVVTGRRSLDEYLPPRQLRMLRLLSFGVQAVVANSEAVAASVRAHEGALEGILRVIPNALPLPPAITEEERREARRSFGLSEGDFVVAYPAHFRHHKGHDHLPAIARAVAVAGVPVVFLLAGDAEGNDHYRNNYRKFVDSAREFDVEDRIRYVGLLGNSRSLLASADAGANFSDLEGMSNTVMETMAAALPVVATAVGGTPELIADGVEGWLVPPGDCATAAERLIRLAAEAETRARMGCAGRERIERQFGVRAMADAYADFYEKLADRGSRTDREGPHGMTQELRNTVRWAALVGAGAAGLTHLHARSRRRGGRWGVILRYHRVIPMEEPRSYYRMGISEQLFARQMRWLSTHRRVVSFDEILERMSSDRTPPEDLVALTFDDGYRDNLSTAAPILRRFGLPALFYVASSVITERMPFWPETLSAAIRMTRVTSLTVTIEREPMDTAASGDGSDRSWPLGTERQRRSACAELIARMRTLPSARIQALMSRILDQLEVPAERAREATPPVMSAKDLRDLAAAGFAIGSHTVTHPYLPAEAPDQQRWELAQAKKALEETIGEEVRDFCYPGGGYDATSMKLVRETGYRSATTTEAGFIGAGDDPVRMARLGAGEALATNPFGRFSNSLMNAEVSGYRLYALRRRRA